MSRGVGAGARGGFNPLRGATTGVVIRRRATTGVMARGFWFFWGGAVGFPWELLRERGVVAVCSEGGCGGEGLTTGVVRHACRHRVTARGVFGLGGLFHTLGAWERHRGGGELLPFVLRVVAGACVGRWTGQPRMPPQERQHEGL